MCVIPEGFGNDFDPLPFDDFERAKERLLERKRDCWSERETVGEEERLLERKRDCWRGKKTKKKIQTVLPFFLVDQDNFSFKWKLWREERKGEVENMQERVREREQVDRLVVLYIIYIIAS